MIGPPRLRISEPSIAGPLAVAGGFTFLGVAIACLIAMAWS